MHGGAWRLLEVRTAGDESSRDLLAWQWLAAGEVRIVAVNAGGGDAQGIVGLPSEVPGGHGDDVVFEDLLDGERYSASRQVLRQSGLYVKLKTGGAHILKCLAGPD
jgi:hypothetical protein